MAYKTLADVPHVSLGGINKNTGKPNPKSIEGYYLRAEDRANTFKPGTTQKFYVFLTKEGEQGVYAKGYMSGEMKKAKPGLMTLLTHTGVGKAQPGKNAPNLYEVQQDPDEVLNESDLQSYSTTSAEDDEPAVEEEEPVDEVVAPRAVAPAKAAVAPSSDRQKKLQDLLNSRTAR